MNRKAQTPNHILLYLIGFLILLLMAVPLLVMPSHYIKQSFANETIKTSLGNQTSSTVVTYMSKIPRIVDGFFVAVFVVVGMFLVVSAFYLDNTPGFLFIFYIVLTVIFLTSLPIINAVHDVTDNGALAVFFDQLPMTMWIVDHWITWEILFGLLIGAAMYSKRNTGGGVQ